MSQNAPIEPSSSILLFITERWKVFPETGEVYNSHGNLVKTLHNSGYLVGSVLGKQILLHHIVWFKHYGKWPTKQLDHRDKVKRNNSIGNLFEVTHSEQMINRDLKGDPSMRGITKVGNKFEVRKSIKGRTQYVGTFNNIPDAQTAFKQKV